MKSLRLISLVFVMVLAFTETLQTQTLFRTTPPPAASTVGPYQGWSSPQTLVPADKNIKIYPIGGTGSYHQTEFSVAVNPTDYNKMLIGANTNNSSSYYQGYYYTVDGGLTWGGGDVLPGITSPCSDPAVGYDANGKVFFNYLQSSDGGFSYSLYVKKSTDNGSTWGAAVEVPTSGDDDKNHFVADNTATSSYANNLYTAYSDFSYTHPPIYFSRSTNGGTSFTSAVNISGSVTSNVSQGVNLAVGRTGILYAIWSVFDGPQNNGESAIGFNKSFNGGASWSGPVRILNIQGICDFNGWTNKNPDHIAVRVNGFPSMAVDRTGGTYDGHLYIVWADKRFDHSDILISVSSDSGAHWTSPIRVNQDAQGNGKDQWMPWVSVSPDGIVSVEFFDSRNDPNNMYVETWMAYSTDGGASFKDFRAIDAAKRFYWYPVSGNYAGDYNGNVATKQFSFPVWADPRSNGSTQQAYTQRFGTYKDVATVYGAWQMVGLPDYVHDSSVAFLYPTRTASNVTTYDVCSGTYFNADPLSTGVGFWAKFGSQQDLTYIGDPNYSFAMPVQTCGSPAWNMIGSISKPVQTSTILQNPAGIVISQYFKTNASGQYVTTTSIDPGMGIWVKVSQPGTLTLQAAPPKVVSTEDQFALLDRFTVKDEAGHLQDMYVRNCTNALEKDEGDVELPPPPPDDNFLARFATNNYVQSVSERSITDLPIVVRNFTSPLTLEWKIRPENNLRYSLYLAEVSKRIDLKGTGSMALNELRVGFVHLTAIAGDKLFPHSFNLGQNYPNPFNPETHINYDLPEPSQVRLLVYDILGRLITSLVDEPQQAGYHAVAFDASGLPSGVYFYRLQAGSASALGGGFTAVKKMILAK